MVVVICRNNAGPVAGARYEPKHPLATFRKLREHRRVGPTRWFMNRGQLQKQFAVGLNHLRYEAVSTP